VSNTIGLVLIERIGLRVFLEFANLINKFVLVLVAQLNMQFAQTQLFKFAM